MATTYTPCMHFTRVGGQVALVDGSVQFISDTIDTKTLLRRSLVKEMKWSIQRLSNSHYPQIAQMYTGKESKQ